MNFENEIVGGYEIKEAITFSNKRGFALAEHPKAPQPYVTWQFFEDENGKRSYEWGHYTDQEHGAQRDFHTRITDYQSQYGVVTCAIFPEMPLYNYFSTQRPVDIGTFPKTANGPLSFVNFDERMKVEDGSFRAWGILTYSAPLTEKQVDDYELRAASTNPIQQKAKLSIAAQLAGGATRATEQEPSDKKQPPKDRGDR